MFFGCFELFLFFFFCFADFFDNGGRQNMRHHLPASPLPVTSYLVPFFVFLLTSWKSLLPLPLLCFLRTSRKRGGIFFFGYHKCWKDAARFIRRLSGTSGVPLLAVSIGSRCGRNSIYIERLHQRALRIFLAICF